MKKEALADLKKVIDDSACFDKDMSKDLSGIHEHLSNVLEEDEFVKEAKLINDGDTVICVDNYAPVFKGRRYVVTDASIPGYLIVREQNDCSDLGIFAVNRFVLDNNEQ